MTNISEKQTEVLTTLSKEVADSSKKKEFCWKIIDGLYENVPEYATSFKIMEYFGVIESTASIVRSNFSRWYKIEGEKNSLEIKAHNKLKSHYYCWVTKCLKEVIASKKIVADENGTYDDLKAISESTPTMNKLLNVLMPPKEAEKFNFLQDEVSDVMSYFRKFEEEITNQLIKSYQSSEKNLT